MTTGPAPYYQDELVQVHLGDCLDILPELPDNSVDAVVTDPPYGLEFMGKDWDRLGDDVVSKSWDTRGRGDNVPQRSPDDPGGRHGVSYKQQNPRCRTCGRAMQGRDTEKGFKVCSCPNPSPYMPNTYPARMQVWHHAWAAECLRILKPGGFLLAFGGTRTSHRLACAVEDAGFEIRDSIAYLHVPRSQQTDILTEWRRWLERAPHVGARLVDVAGSVPEPVLLSTSHVRSPADAIIAELTSSEALRTDAEPWRSALSPADVPTTASSALVTIAENLSESPEAKPDTHSSTAPASAPAWLSESIAGRLKAATALRIWLGSKPSTRQAATDALCAALTDDLKLITCAQSRTFQSYDTTSQTVSVSATTVTITAYTAANLISFTADTLASQGGEAKESLIGSLAWVYGSGFP